MTEADKLFLNSNYRKTTTSSTHMYHKNSSSHQSQYYFNLHDKSITIARLDKSFRHQSKTITLEQLKALIKKCEELGWI